MIPPAHAAAHPIPLAAAGRGALWWLWGPILLAISIEPLIRLFAGKSPVTTAFASWGPLVVLPLLALALSLLYRRRSITLDGGQLDIVSTLYRKRVALGELRLDRARAVRFDEYPDFKPASKANGFQFPGFRSGHFRMPDGGKAFCLITDNQRVLVLPLRDGSVVLVSPEQPRQLLDELRRLAERRVRP
ncbi:PH domain-containing protein [Stenotrophomonas sp. MH1]|uniref:PH domain-containing protein n=1 Tax=Stenotrophomonas capsici TaxID=3110230 RepID=A0ABU5UZ34_9GAMM|nr:PH domain-containing protein [Stenotrophomonas sp. MH1]MEA5666354.1 PH domain-containing protein [Stenotrophomonas sp. MH1]